MTSRLSDSLKVTIIFGGTSSERRVSVASAQHLSSVLPEADLWYWTPSGQVVKIDASVLASHQNPFDQDFAPASAPVVGATVDAALDQGRGRIFYLGLHGGDGENGWIQAKLESRGLPFTGSSSQSSAIAMNKSKSKEAVQPRGVLMARQLLFTPGEAGAGRDLTAFQKSNGRIVIKPACDGSSAGLAFISTSDECAAWIEKNKGSRDPWLAEERIDGRELTVGVIMHRGCLSVLPPSEVVLERNAHFDFQAKYHGVGNKEITPAELTIHQAAGAQAVAILAHAALGCYGYTRTDMIMTDRGFYYLETNTLPGMTRASFIPQQLQAAGISVRDFVEGQLENARRRYE